jgi:hypothetical protein
MTKEFSKKDTYPSPDKAFAFSLQSISEIKNDCLFVLDANVLLLPFTTDVKNLEAIKRVYKDLAENDKLFLPAQAVREYLDNRAKKLADINEALSKKSNQSFNYVGAHPLLGDLDTYKKVLEQETVLKAAIKSYQDKIRETLDAVQAWGWNDPVSKMYHEVLIDRVLKDDALDLAKISEDLKRRNELNIPPGYKDKSKQENAAGDLLIWNELLSLGENKASHVIFISGDEKADWWHQSGKNPLYPRFELVDEFRERTGGKSFHIISLSKLLRLFETDDVVVNSIKNSEEESKAKAGSDLDLSKNINDKSSRYEAVDEYKKHLKIPENHKLFVLSSKWKVKGGYDTDTYELVEVNENGEEVSLYRFYDSTKTTPPFGRELYAEKI